jgi:uncharacterized protein YlxW (UPF0749 family)
MGRATAGGRRPLSRPNVLWRVLVPLACLLAGFVFATSAHDSRGTNLRPPGFTDLSDLVAAAEQRVHTADGQVARLQAEVNAATRQAAQGDSAVAAAQAMMTPFLQPGGLSAVHGPGTVVVLDDAPAANQPSGVDLNQLLVHQSDIRAVVNALWAGGAEAMSIMGQRVVATSSVRCVGPTLLINGEVFSPPYRIVAIGPADSMSSALDASSGVALFKQAAEYFGLGYTVESSDDVQVPAYTGAVGLQYAKPVAR